MSLPTLPIGWLSTPDFSAVESDERQWRGKSPNGFRREVGAVPGAWLFTSQNEHVPFQTRRIRVPHWKAAAADFKVFVK